MTLTQADLSQFTGTHLYYTHGLSKHFLYTEGVQYVARTGQAYWLLDAIASVIICKPRVARQPFQVWTLTVKNKRGTLRCEDGNGKVVYRQVVPYTDFPLESMTFYYENSVLCLPSER